MNQKPSIDDLIEGVIVAIGAELLPHLNNERAMASAVMMQSVLQAVRQTLPRQLPDLVDEHNDMTATLRRAAAALDGVTGPEADRIRDRAATLGQLPDLPAPPDIAAIDDTHGRLGAALESTIADLDVIQRGDDPAAASAADAALTEVRAHLGPRYLRHVQMVTVGEGFVGRG